jgi:hypothetical protein
MKSTLVCFLALLTLATAHAQNDHWSKQRSASAPAPVPAQQNHWQAARNGAPVQPSRQVYTNTGGTHWNGDHDTRIVRVDREADHRIHGHGRKQWRPARYVKHDNGKHKGWYKGHGNPHRNAYYPPRKRGWHER